VRSELTNNRGQNSRTKPLKLDNAAGEAWVEQLPYSRGLIHVTADELKEFFEEYIKLLYRYQPSAERISPDARPMVTSFMAYPAPPAPVTDTPAASAPNQQGGAAEEG
jgi:hypothetical protein